MPNFSWFFDTIAEFKKWISKRKRWTFVKPIKIRGMKNAFCNWEQLVNGALPKIIWFYESIFCKIEASYVRLGAVLTQEYKVKGKKIIYACVICKQVSIKEPRDNIEWQVLKHLLSIGQWRRSVCTLWGMFKVVAYCNALEAFVKKATLECWLACWSDFLMCFNIRDI